MQEITENVRTISADRVDASRDGGLVHVSSDKLAASEPLVDRDFMLGSDSYFKIQRHTEYCQWHESHTESTEKVRLSAQAQ